MNKQEEIKQEIIKLCGSTYKVSSFGWHFVRNDLHYFYVPDKENKFIRITIPHIIKVDDANMENVTEIINETNREVKFIKAVVLENGSISISYDHKVAEQEDISQIVSHIINTLDFASTYLMNKIKEKSC